MSLRKYLDDDPDGLCLCNVSWPRFYENQKKGQFEFALLNSTSNVKKMKIILTGLVQSKPNDNNALREYNWWFKRNFNHIRTITILLMVKDQIIKEIRDALEKYHNEYLDSGYF